jgi:hypothetical protein
MITISTRRTGYYLYFLMMAFFASIFDDEVTNYSKDTDKH